MSEDKSQRWGLQKSWRRRNSDFQAFWRSFRCMMIKVENLFSPFWVGATFFILPLTDLFPMIILFLSLSKKKRTRENVMKISKNGWNQPPPRLLNLLLKSKSFYHNDCVKQSNFTWSNLRLTSTSTTEIKPFCSEKRLKIKPSTKISFKAFFNHYQLKSKDEKFKKMKSKKICIQRRYKKSLCPPTTKKWPKMQSWWIHQKAKWSTVTLNKLDGFVSSSSFRREKLLQQFLQMGGS